MISEIREMIGAYKATYGQEPTHITLNPDEERRLREALRKLPYIKQQAGFEPPAEGESLHGGKFMGVEIRINEHTPDGFRALPPTRVTDG